MRVFDTLQRSRQAGLLLFAALGYWAITAILVAQALCDVRPMVIGCTLIAGLAATLDGVVRGGVARRWARMAAWALLTGTAAQGLQTLVDGPTDVALVGLWSTVAVAGLVALTGEGRWSAARDVRVGILWSGFAVAVLLATSASYHRFLYQADASVLRRVLLTIVWATLGASLVVSGIAWSRPTRQTVGMAVLGLASLKSLLYDAFLLSGASRVLDLFLMGALFLGAWFATRVHSDKRDAR